MPNLLRSVGVGTERIYGGRFGTNGGEVMHPVDFLKKHIIAKLVAEGFSEAVAKGGDKALSNTGACRNRAKRAPLMTASVTPVSGLSVRQQQRSVRRARKTRREAT
jgi:hypothetical protein